jgi:AcrR family transcriptional regulator
MATPPAPEPAPRFDRRAQRRQQTLGEILDLALEVMAEDGVTGLTISAVARRLGVQPPSIYKYFPSLMSVYDALFRRGQTEHLEVVRAAMSAAEPGLRAWKRAGGGGWPTRCSGS